jgi:hypothetical protein
MPPASEQSPSAFPTRRNAVTRGLTGYPRKAKPCTEIKSGVTKPSFITKNINNKKREIFIKISKGKGYTFSFNILSPTSTLHR